MLADVVKATHSTSIPVTLSSSTYLARPENTSLEYVSMNTEHESRPILDATKTCFSFDEGGEQQQRGENYVDRPTDNAV